MYPYFYLLSNYFFFSNWTFFVQRHTIANVLLISVAHLVSGTQSSIDSIFHVCFSTFFFFCFVSWKAICFTYCSLAKPLQFTNLLWVKPYSSLAVFNSCPQSPYPSVLGFWKIRLEKSSPIFNWIFSLKLELDFYCLCSLQNQFRNWFMQVKNPVRPTRFFKNQVQVIRANGSCDLFEHSKD